MLRGQEGSQATLNRPSLAVPPNDSNDAPSMTERNTNYAPPIHPINEVRRTRMQPINVSANGIIYQAALSPRTTRDNMVAAELTEWLRQHLVRERLQNTSATNGALNLNLKQHPEEPFMKGEDKKDLNPSSWDD
ncbi:DUF1752-domain-containing protein [Canariomyces notabilis]|uniref:DUF1752-domain-containing protein n=1 Tax=Canariomyces notabilis TaxID=2074819 RepID=A0AAN6T7A9_9PEZI|nr:DUF1752-domain-containing protein [Canariomyces arenarius]